MAGRWEEEKLKGGGGGGVSEQERVYIWSYEAIKYLWAERLT